MCTTAASGSARRPWLLGISRKQLLDISPAGARPRVDIRFRTEVDDFEAEVFRQADLVWRRRREQQVRARYAETSSRSSTCGPRSTSGWHPQLFDAFQFIFEENDDGLFQVHGYRFDRDTSTFIVECDPASWKKRGSTRRAPRRASPTGAGVRPALDAMSFCDRSSG